MEEQFEADIAAIQRIAAVPRILDIVCRLTGMGFAAVARVTEDRWIACQVLDNIGFGLAIGGELKVETTLCKEVRELQEVIVFDHAAEDPVYCGHPTPRMYGLQSYIATPILLPDGTFYGTLCAIDPAPHKINTPEIVGTFKLFADLIGYHLDADENLRQSRTELAEAKTAGIFREQVIAVLGHDLRNPLAALDAGTSMIIRDGWTGRTPTILQHMKASIKRAQELVENVMDFARSKLGNGIALDLTSERNLETTLFQVVDEMRVANPDRIIETTFAFTRGVKVDHSRVAQMFANLLGNAIAHGAQDGAIRVVARADEDAFELAVLNGGDPIPSAIKDQLFEPFYRGNSDNSKGLGLGLYIASQIADAHGGRIEVRSDESETAFTFRMPVNTSP